MTPPNNESMALDRLASRFVDADFGRHGNKGLLNCSGVGRRGSPMLHARWHEGIHYRQAAPSPMFSMASSSQQAKAYSHEDHQGPQARLCFYSKYNQI
jgi:hypothetical protein